MDMIKEKVPGKLMTAGILMMIYSGLNLFLILVLLFIPFIISWIVGIPVGSMSDMLVGWMNATGGSADPGPVTISILTGAAYLVLILMIVYFSLMFAYGLGFVRGRLTKRPPYYLAVLTFTSAILPPWGVVFIAAKVVIGILMIAAFRDERVQMLYERAKDPQWESRLPPPEIPPMPTQIVGPGRESVSAIVLD